MVRSTLALLMFNRNQNEGVIKNVNILKDIVDEIVVIDNSSDELHGRLKRMLEALSLPCEVYHVLSVGYADPLRMYGLSKVKSDYVLYLDTDETPSPDLLRQLHSFNSYDAYVISAMDPSGFQTHGVRLFKKKAVKYVGRIHEPAIVDGTMCKLSMPYCIFHTPPLVRDIRRYLEIEAYVRPFPYRFVPRRFREISLHVIPSAEPLQTKTIEILSIFFAFGLYVKFEDLRNPGHLLAWLQYFRACWKFFKRKTIEEQRTILNIHDEIEQAGGLIRYLSLDNPEYVERLTSVIDLREDGIQIFKRLLNFRYIHGRCMDVRDIQMPVQKIMTAE